MQRRDIRAQRADKQRVRLLLEREPHEASDFPDTVISDEMPELAAWEWPMPNTNQPKEQQS